MPNCLDHNSESMREFVLEQDLAVTGVCGIGLVAGECCSVLLLPLCSGSVVGLPSTVVWPLMDTAESVHGHGGDTPHSVDRLRVAAAPW